MADYILSCCSTVDISAEHLAKRNLSYACFHYYMDGVAYSDDLGKSMPFETFYAKMVAGADTKTSQINMDEFIAYFTPFLKEGKDILHVTLSSGLSGVTNSAMAAAKVLSESYPERKIYIVDSLGASSGYGLLMDKAADLRDGGMTIDQLRDWLLEHRLEMNHWFFSTDLTFYIKGGRVSKVSGWFGTVLKICPLLNMDNAGKLIPRFKIRGKKNVMTEIVQKMKEYAIGGTNYNDKCYISHSACLEDAKAVAAMIEAAFPHLNGKVEINDIGTTIGSHTGPGTVAVFFWGKRREKDL